MGSAPRPSRHLELEGAHNVRDIGGYPTLGGRTTRWMTLLRADGLHRLSAGSQAALVDSGLRTVIDLRRTDEVREQPDVFATSGQVTYFHHNMTGDAPRIETEAPPPPRLGAAMIAERYAEILDGRLAQVGETLAILATPGRLPALFHCTAGKDRAGLISALLLGLAGVPAETIAEDYGLSAPYLLGRYLNEQAPPDVAASGYTWEDYQRDHCPPEAMRATLRHLDERYGGVEGYVREAGLTQEQIDGLRSAIVA